MIFFLRLQNAHKLHRYFSKLPIHILQIFMQFDHSVFSGYSNLTNSIVSVYMQSISSSHLGSIIEVTQATEQCKMSPLGILVFLKILPSIPNLILPRTKSSQYVQSFLLAIFPLVNLNTRFLETLSSFCNVKIHKE